MSPSELNAVINQSKRAQALRPYLLTPPDYGPEKTAPSMSSRLREYLKERCIS
jgi:hypothetical protein